MAQEKKINKKKNSEDLIIDRISRIEGQLGGIRRMVAEKKECLSIITQITAIREAVNMLGVELLKNDICHTKRKIDEAYLKTIFKIK